MEGGLNELALFAGGGGGILGGKLLGWRTACAVEIVPSARSILFARQREGFLEPLPIWDDVSTFDGRPWKGSIDVVTGGFPCQDISCQGKGAGIDGKRSGLVFEMLRIVDEVRPSFVLAENSPMLANRGLARILPALAELGYVGAYGVFTARHIGAPHERGRMFVLAADTRQEIDPEFFGLPKKLEPTNTHEDDFSQVQRLEPFESLRPWRGCESLLQSGLRRSRPFWALNKFGRVDDGLADRMDRLAAIGNGQVPRVVKLVWESLIPVVQKVYEISKDG